MELKTLPLATDWFAAVLDTVSPERYGESTPCSEWNVVELIDHVLGGNLWAAGLLEGLDSAAAREAIAARFATEPMPTDRRQFADLAARSQAEAFAAAEPDRTVQHPVGPVSAAQFLGMRTIDVTAHAWDLARAVGADETVPPALITALMPIAERSAPLMAGSGMFGSGAEGAPEAANEQERFLHLLGRRP